MVKVGTRIDAEVDASSMLRFSALSDSIALRKLGFSDFQASSAAPVMPDMSP